MQDTNNPQGQVLDNTLGEADGLEAARRATEAALEASGMGERVAENPAVAEILEGSLGNEGKSDTQNKGGERPKIVGLSDARQEVGIEAPVKDVENNGVADGTGGAQGNSGSHGGGGQRNSNPQEGAKKKEVKDKVLGEVIKKIRDAENVLVTLSNDPSVDEMAGAIGLSLALDMIGKHATAIYSGKTPNVLEFLKPEETFEVNANVLQDFVIALNKDKADHLRYKIEGDYVKVYVTPYKSLISEGDLEFSRGDYNVDLVIALNVPAATELDAALREYGRIMHDATSVNITNEIAGKFGDVEWVDPRASSVSEMVARLVMELTEEMDAGVATALLTGIVAATDKFANQATSPEVMMLAAKLMGYGANQQAVFKNISQKLEFRERNDVLAMGEAPAVEAKVVDTSKLTVGHNGFSDSVEGGEMEKYVDLSADAGGARGIVGLGDSRGEVGEEGYAGGAGYTGAGEMDGIANEVKVQQAGYEEAVENSVAQGRGGILGSVQSVLQSVMNRNGANGYEGSANGDTGAGAGFVVGGEDGGAGESNGLNDGSSGGAESGTNSVVDEILSGLKKDGGNESAAGGVGVSGGVGGGQGGVAGSGLPDYGKMIDEALSEKMPGEEGAEPTGAGVGSMETGVNLAGGDSAIKAANLGGVVERVEATGVPAEVSSGLPMPGNELGVPPAPVVDLNGLPQMPPVVGTGVSMPGAVDGIGVEGNGLGGGNVAEMSTSEAMAGGGNVRLNGAGGVVVAGGGASGSNEVGGVATVGENAVAPSGPVVSSDPGQFHIPGQ